MNIVFYSSNSNNFNNTTFYYTNYPTNSQIWNNYLNKHPQDVLFFITELPGLFLLDVKNNTLYDNLNTIQYYIQQPTVDLIEKLNPDLIIPLSFWTVPFDWLPLEDSLIADELKSKGYNVIANSTQTSYICYDKKQTRDFLMQNNFNCAKSIYIHHQMYWIERGQKEIKRNVYKEYVHSEIKKMHLPLIIKDIFGLSSYGMEVVNTHNQAIGFLNSKRNNGDRLVEEYISGINFGLEIYGTEKDGYKICDPFIFSVNKYGITSPKQSLKIGPITNNNFNIDILKQEMLRLAKELHLNGIAQIDLIYEQNEKKWYIIEINPRLSGMTYSTIVSKQNPNNLILSIKLPLLSNNDFNELKKISFVKHLSQVENLEAKQEREKGYCEVIIATDKKNEEINLLKEKFPHLIDSELYKTEIEMFKFIDL